MTDLRLIAEKLGRAQPLLLDIDPLTAFTLVGLLQLSLRHPEMSSGYGAETATQMARTLQGALGEIDPLISEALDLGWNPDLDMTKEEFSEFEKTGQQPVRGTYNDLDRGRKEEILAQSRALAIAIAFIVQTTGQSPKKVANQFISEANEVVDQLSEAQIEAEIQQLEVARGELEGRSDRGVIWRRA